MSLRRSARFRPKSFSQKGSVLGSQENFPTNLNTTGPALSKRWLLVWRIPAGTYIDVAKLQFRYIRERDMERIIPVRIHMFPSFHTCKSGYVFSLLRDEIMKSDILKPCNLNFLGFGTLKILLMYRILSCLLTPSKHIKARVPFVSVAGKCLSLHEMPPLTLLENHQSNTIYNCFVFVKIQLDLGTKRPSANCAIPPAGFQALNLDAALPRKRRQTVTKRILNLRRQ